MKVMVIIKADKESEAGVLPDQEFFNEMGKFNEALVKAGVMLTGQGLQPSSKGARVKFSRGKHIVTDGPFAETKELIAGFWLWQVKGSFCNQDVLINIENPVFANTEFGMCRPLRLKESTSRSQLSAPTKPFPPRTCLESLSPSKKSSASATMK